MPRRTTVVIDQQLLERAMRALGGSTTRWTVEEALRRVVESVGDERTRRAEGQRHYLRALDAHLDLAVLASNAMWRPQLGD